MQLSEKASAVSPSATLAIDSKFKEMKANGEDVVGFGAGEPDFDTPQHIKDAAIRAIMDNKTRYTPAAGTLELRRAVAKKFRETGKEDVAVQIEKAIENFDKGNLYLSLALSLVQ